MSAITPPKGDEVIERHQFYATTASQVVRSAEDINAIGQKLTDSSKSFHELKDGVKVSETQLKTFLTIVVIVWTVIGSGVGLYIQRGLASYDQLQTTITTLQTEAIINKGQIEALKDTPAQIESIRRTQGTLQPQIDSINDRLGKR